MGDPQLHTSLLLVNSSSLAAYSNVWDFEKDFDQWSAQRWVQVHWVPLCTTSGLLYMATIFSLQSWMANRPPLKLRTPLAAWSVFLAVFSIMGFLRTAPELLHTLHTGGLRDSVCNPSFLESNKVSAFWTWLFTLSKLLEFGDTLFIVLRKQKLIFLHWWHHLTVMFFVFYCFSEFTPFARWFMVVNYFVHSIMYTYYALKAMSFKVPRVIAMMITSLQLLQMAVDIIVTYLAFQFRKSGVDCKVNGTSLVLNSFIVASYLVLFARFFYQAYFRAGKKGQEENSAMSAEKLQEESCAMSAEKLKGI